MIKGILLIALTTTMICSCMIPTLKETVEFTITSWEQEYYTYLDEWSMVEIYYEVKNNGDVDIDFYYVYFEVKCTDGSIYYDYDIGVYLKKGKRMSHWTIVDTAGKEADTVEITDYEIEVY